MPNKTVGVIVSQQVEAQLAALAQADMISVSAICRQLIVRGLEHVEPSRTGQQSAPADRVEK